MIGDHSDYFFSLAASGIGEVVDLSAPLHTLVSFSQGPANNFLVHETLHFTINAEGTVTVSHDNISVDCK